METKFTPGPWQTDDGEGDYFGVFDDNGASLALLAEPRPRPYFGMQPLPLQEGAQPGDDFNNWEVHKANANLIAAAPDLYDALADTWRIIDAAGLLNLSNGVQLGQTSWYVKASDMRTIAEAALSKARGEA